MLPEPSPVGGGGGETSSAPRLGRLCLRGGRVSTFPSATLAPARTTGAAVVRGGGPLRLRAGQAVPPTPIPPPRGHHTATCRGLRLFLGAYAAAGRATALSRKGTLLKNSPNLKIRCF